MTYAKSAMVVAVALALLNACGDSRQEPGAGKAGKVEAPLPSLEEMLAKAEAGDPVAQVFVGKHYYSNENYAAAIQWFERAAILDSVPAQLAYATMIENGQGVKQDLFRATIWYWINYLGCERKSDQVCTDNAVKHLKRMEESISSSIESAGERAGIPKFRNPNLAAVPNIMQSAKTNAEMFRANFIADAVRQAEARAARAAGQSKSVEGEAERSGKVSRDSPARNPDMIEEVRNLQRGKTGPAEPDERIILLLAKPRTEKDRQDLKGAEKEADNCSNSRDCIFALELQAAKLMREGKAKNPEEALKLLEPK